jgi:hypothetical protein
MHEIVAHVTGVVAVQADAAAKLLDRDRSEHASLSRRSRKPPAEPLTEMPGQA